MNRVSIIVIITATNIAIIMNKREDRKMEKQWLERLDNRHILYCDYITENVCFSSIDYMSSVIKKHNPNATFKIKLSLGKKEKTIVKNLNPLDIKLYIDEDLINARVVKVYEIDDEYTFIVMF